MVSAHYRATRGVIVPWVARYGRHLVGQSPKRQRSERSGAGGYRAREEIHNVILLLDLPVESVQRAGDSGGAERGNVGVDHGGLDILVTEQLLDGTNVVARL